MFSSEVFYIMDIYYIVICLKICYIKKITKLYVLKEKKGYFFSDFKKGGKKYIKIKCGSFMLSVQWGKKI